MASVPVTVHDPAPQRPPGAPATGRGALAAVGVLLLAGALTWLIFGYATDHFVDADAKRVAERTKILADRNAEDAKLLHDPASWQAKDKGVVRVPIERAIDLTIADLQKVQPHPAYPVTQSPPQPATVPAASAGGSPPAAAPVAASPSPSPAPAVAPPGGTKPESLTTPPTQPTPASATTPSASDAATPTPAPTVPGASPAGTP